MERRESTPLLSKSRFLAGIQCHKRLYLECYHRELMGEVDASQQAVFDMGTRIGELARGLRPGGVVVGEDHLHHQNAVKATAALLADKPAASIYEAAFTHDGVRIRIDILARAGRRRYDIIEVKSSGSTKPEHLPDVGIQVYVLQGCGVPLGRACLAHINTEYVYPGGAYDLEQLFTVDDMTDAVSASQEEVMSALGDMRVPLWSSTPPDIPPGEQCSQPHECSFYAHCHKSQPEHHISQLPRARCELLDSLSHAGIHDIRNIPPGFPGLTPLQQRVRDCVVNDSVYVDPELPARLQRLEYPVHFLDFETFNPALPLYAGTRPYQVIPFQWSVHTLSRRDGRSRHDGFLHEESSDPRRPFAETLLKALGRRGSIVVYSDFENSRIQELARAIPDLSTRLLALQPRLVDLLKLVRSYCYHPAFHGSFSIKSVVPALVPGLDYAGLEVSDGAMASTAYAEVVAVGTPQERRDHLLSSLREYCKRDTEAELALFKRFVS
jgi:hypothetical protein